MHTCRVSCAPTASNSPHDEFDQVSSVFDDGDGVRVEHALGRVSIHLQ